LNPTHDTHFPKQPRERAAAALSGVAKNIKLNKRATSRVKRTAAIFRRRQGK